MRWFPRSLFGRLIVVLTVGITVALIGSAAVNLHERHHIIEHARYERFAQRIATMTHLFDRLAPPERRQLARVMSDHHFHIRVTPAPGTPPRKAPLPPHYGQLESALAAQLGPSYSLRITVRQEKAGRRPGDTQLRTISIRLHDGKWLTLVDRHTEPPSRQPYALLIQLGIVLLVALLLSLLAVKWTTRPLGMLAAAANALGRDIHRPPLPETGPTEVRHAAAAFNLMQQRLLGFLAHRLQMLTAISHDLKTPVTRLRLRAEMLDDPTLRDEFNRDLDEMDAMLSATLAYMRGEAEREQVQSLDVNALLESMIADAQALGQEASLSGRADAPYRGRPRALRRAIENLVQNALRYGGSAGIEVTETPQALVIRVADRGPGLAESELEKVFEPFYRAEGSRNRETGGTGLGLAIARDVAESHGGTLKLANRAGGGLVATLTLPR